MKAGSAKRTLDHLTKRIADPVADLVLTKLHEQFPNAGFAAPTVQALIHASLLLGLAELLNISKPFVPYEPKRVQDLEIFVRTYAGEKTGTEAVDLLTRMIPLLLQSFSDLDLTDCAVELLPTELEPEDSFAPLPLVEEMPAGA